MMTRDSCVHHHNIGHGHAAGITTDLYFLVSTDLSASNDLLERKNQPMTNFLKCKILTKNNIVPIKEKSKSFNSIW